MPVASSLTPHASFDRKRRRKPFKPDDFNPCVTTKPAPAKASVEQVAGLLGAKFVKAQAGPQA